MSSSFQVSAFFFLKAQHSITHQDKLEANQPIERLQLSVFRRAGGGSSKPVSQPAGTRTEVTLKVVNLVAGARRAAREVSDKLPLICRDFHTHFDHNSQLKGCKDNGPRNREYPARPEWADGLEDAERRW